MFFDKHNYISLEHHDTTTIIPVIILVFLIVLYQLFLRSKMTVRIERFVFALIIGVFLIGDYYVDTMIMQTRSLDSIIVSICTLDLVFWFLYLASGRDLYRALGLLLGYGPILTLLTPSVHYLPDNYAYYAHYIGHSLSVFMISLFTWNFVITWVLFVTSEVIFLLITLMNYIRNLMLDQNYFFLMESPIGNHIGWYSFSNSDYLLLYVPFLVLLSCIMLLLVKSINLMKSNVSFLSDY